MVYIGRFQPCHRAHIQIINKARELAKSVIVLVGSAHQPRTIENPWTWEERRDMIFESLDKHAKQNVAIVPVRDIVYNNDAWLEQVQEIVMEHSLDNDKIGIIGYSKDETSFYLKSFPQWKTIEVNIIEDLHATDVREAMWINENFDDEIGKKLPEAIHDYIKSFMLKPEYEKLVEEYQFQLYHDRMWDMDKMLDYFLEQELPAYKGVGECDAEQLVGEIVSLLRRSQYKVAPYKPYFNTVDCVVVQSGHVLLVRRRAAPGKGLYAMPGGYLNHNEWSIDGAMRELKEETKIKVAPAILQGNIKDMQVFEHPKRSLRGRIITHTYIISLPDGELPKVKGGDDADKAKWVPLSVFKQMEDQMFEDHYHIINDMIAKLKRKH